MEDAKGEHSVSEMTAYFHCWYDDLTPGPGREAPYLCLFALMLRMAITTMPLRGHGLDFGLGSRLPVCRFLCASLCIRRTSQCQAKPWYGICFLIWSERLMSMFSMLRSQSLGVLTVSCSSLHGHYPNLKIHDDIE